MSSNGVYDGVVWVKSSFSDQHGNECVEVATLSDDVRAVRDSKNPTGPVLTFSTAEWSAFVHGVRYGEFD